jgi:cytoskeletal protein CcmA (bactofilin family)
MFGGQDKNRKYKGKAHTLISESTEVLGDIRFSGELIVEGKVTGSISASDDSDAILRVAEQGEIDGDIKVPLVIINGLVSGDVRASKHIELAGKAKVTGNVYFQVIEIVLGAQINGSLVCDIKPDSKPKALTYTEEPRQGHSDSLEKPQGNS